MKIFRAFAALSICVATISTAQAAPISYAGTLNSGVTSFGDVPFESFRTPGSWDYWLFAGNAGDVISITANRTSDQMDPGVILYAGVGADSAGLGFFNPGNSTDGLLTFLALNDDDGSDVPPGPFFNSLISNFSLTSTGLFTIAVFDVLGAATGPWTYGVTVSGATGTMGTIPEPTTFALAGLALAGLMLGNRRKQAG